MAACPVLPGSQPHFYDETELEVRGPPLPVADRYYTKYYCVDMKDRKGQDFCILQHSNSCIKGFLVEINEKLVSNPELLLTKPIGEGYIAIVMPKLVNADSICSSLLSEKQYQDALKTRTCTALGVAEESAGTPLKEQSHKQLP